MYWPFFRYIALTYLWLGIAWYLSRGLEDLDLLSAILASLFLAIPVFFSGLYGSTIAKIRWLKELTPESRLRKLFGGLMLATILWMVFAVCSGFAWLFWFGGLDQQLTWLVVISVPGFYLSVRLFQKLAQGEFSYYLTRRKSIRAAQFALSIIFALLVALVPPEKKHNKEESFSEVLRSIQDSDRSDSDSALIQTSHRFYNYYDASRSYLSDRIANSNSRLPFLIVSVSSFAVFFSIFVMCAAFLVPSREYQRIFSELLDVDAPLQAEPSRIITTAALATIFVLFICVPGLAYLNSSLERENGQISDAEDAVITAVEVIEDKYYQTGTIEEVRRLRGKLLGQRENLLNDFVEFSELGFRLMVNNIDHYLDWYYSLPAEYLRIAAMLTNDLEKQLSEDIVKHLSKNNPFGAMEREFQPKLKEYQGLLGQYDAEVKRLLTTNQVTIEDGQTIKITDELPNLESLDVPSFGAKIDVENRVLVSGAGAISAVVAAKVVGKTAGKTAVSVAAKALGKVATIKVSSGAAGAVIGGMIGSVIPVAGTLAGTAIGATVGILIGVSIDKLLLVLEENLSRDTFHQKLLNAIMQYRRSVYNDMGIETPKWKVRRAS